MQPPKTTEYKSYLEYELKKGDPARIQCLYERAIKDNCLVGDMWTEYTSYLVRHLNSIFFRILCMYILQINVVLLNLTQFPAIMTFKCYLK